MWGDFSDQALEVLKGLLDRCSYLETARLPGFRTRQIYPLRDLGHAWGALQGRPPSLSAVSFPRLRLRRMPPGALELHRVFFGHEPLPEGLLRPEEQKTLTEAEILGPEGATVQIAAACGLYLLSSIPRRSPGEFVYLGDDTGILLDWNGQARGKRALDMGTGNGAVALSLAPRFECVLGVDVNETALCLARSNARLNRCRVDFARSDLWEGVQGRFDWITANLPALPLDPTPNLSFAAAGSQDPTVLTRRFFERLPEFLQAGECRMLTFSPVDAQGDRLWREAGERLGKLSLEYRVQDEMPLASPTFRKLRHVAVRVLCDGQARREFHEAPWWRRLALPLLSPGRPVQRMSVGRV